MVITINPNTDMLPLNVATARAVPRAYEEESKTVTEMLLEKNVITEVSTPTAVSYTHLTLPTTPYV